MKNPKVSVIMPAYNVEKYIAEAIESILNQTFNDFEFIILNDGSTDNTPKIIAEYAKKDKRIKFINNQKNQGFISSLNECLNVACGEYIAKMDSDDISLPERLEKQVNYLDSNPDIGLVGCGYKAFDKDNFSIIHPAQVSLLGLLNGCCTTIFLLRKSVIDKYNLRFRKEYIHAEDYDFYARFLKYAPINNIQEVLYLYRWHGENISITKAKEQLESSNKVRQDILDFLTDDEELQQKIMNLVCPPPQKLKYTFLQRIFSLRNQKAGDKKKKILMILGVKIKLKKEPENA